LVEQVERAANQMPERLPARAVLPKLRAARLWFCGESGGGPIDPCLIGDMARFFREAADAVEAIAAEDPPELAALRPAAERLVASVERTGIGVDVEPLTPAPWPPGGQGEVRAQLDTLEGELGEAQERAPDAETEQRLGFALGCVETLRGDVEQPEPSWAGMRSTSRELVRRRQPALDPASAQGQGVAGSRALIDHLGDVAEEAIAGLPDLAVFRDFSDAPVVVVIPAGSFLMGSPETEAGRDDDEGPRHEVTIRRRFALGRYTVTFEEHGRFRGATGRERPGDRDWGRGRMPVINVSWEDASAYCAWLSSGTGKGYRLPSDAEWEYACRAGRVTACWWGDSFDATNANADGKMGRTSEVGTYPANPWRLHDMCGNVWEWCADASHGGYEGAPTNGSSRLEGGSSGRVVRGGSWDDQPDGARGLPLRARASVPVRRLGLPGGEDVYPLMLYLFTSWGSGGGAPGATCQRPFRLFRVMAGPRAGQLPDHAPRRRGGRLKSGHDNLSAVQGRGRRAHGGEAACGAQAASPTSPSNRTRPASSASPRAPTRRTSRWSAVISGASRRAARAR
jgi:formylglycine-generating enzyme required for sulfatase activity